MRSSGEGAGISTETRESGSSYDCDADAKTADLSEISECRKRQRVSLIESVGQLAGIERGGDAIARRFVERLGKVRILSPLWIERSKEPQLVFLQSAT